MNVCLDESDVRVVLDSPVTSKLSCRVLFQLTFHIDFHLIAGSEDAGELKALILRPKDDIQVILFRDHDSPGRN